MNSTPEHTIAEMQAWAAGSYPLEAAVELLAHALDGRFARPGQPWIGTSDGAPFHAWLQAGVLADAAAHGPYSGGERRLLAIAASLAGGGPVELDEVIPGLDRHLLDLVLAAVAHAGGSHEHATPVLDPATGRFTFTRHASLHPWPAPGPDHDSAIGPASPGTTDGRRTR